MILDFGYGTGVQRVEVPDGNLAGVLRAGAIPVGLGGEAEVRRALAEPIGSKRLRDIVRPGEKIVIVTSDVTRPMPTALVMPAILDELWAAGADMRDVTLAFARGSHRAQTDAERRRLSGERAYQEIACVDADPDDCVRLGVTKRGTRVDIARLVAGADRRICLGNVEFHYFAGYSGGAKAIFPGVAARASIRENHSLMADENACAGKLAGNPLREDLEEAADLCCVDFILNVVLDEHKNIVRAGAGDVRAAHRAMCAYLDSLYKKPIPRRADIVIVSQGGAPKDLNLYQTQKALDNAKHAVRPGGEIILIGACNEGMGEKTFEAWMTGAQNSADLIDRIKRDFQLGGHKAAAIAMILQNATIRLVSEMPPDFVRSIFLTPHATAQSALDAAFARLGPDATVLAMPYGGSTLPVVEV